ncbi:MAG: FliM/FliN family flagellar motor switch protein [Fulvimarina manganoxydans]|uniref:FliM/FliN family flagellar motor switch protein n=1 Tax=Fulvimarina manganoxydans TaxID=937218 RepID=UPI0023524B64|nr:FliM/FliN family flagellar motor switch protein [Fulvimarina manganoxydans]MCK5933254.1 FliM/FliN family flagellar motor switch protein [Fulvimarina manganoxydans]
MSNTAAVETTTDIGARLRNAAQVEPSRLPRLSLIGEKTAVATGEDFDRLSIKDAEVVFLGLDMGPRPDAEDEDNADQLVASFKSRRFARPSFMSVSKSFVESAIQIFFGAAPAREGSPERALTDLDKAVVKMALQTLLSQFDKALRDVDQAGLSFGSFAEPEQFGDVFGGLDESFVLMRFEVARGEAKHVITLALPNAYVALIRRSLIVMPEPPQPSPDEAWTEAIERNFEKSDLSLEAVLARKKVPLSMVARFRVGQTLALETGVAEAIAIECEGKPLFKAQVGFARESYVVRFDKRIDPTQEFIDGILAD